jgi:hypothetical protein
VQREHWRGAVKTKRWCKQNSDPSTDISRPKEIMALKGALWCKRAPRRRGLTCASRANARRVGSSGAQRRDDGDAEKETLAG